MMQVITQQTFGPPEPPRQDVVSAILDDYSNSFESYTDVKEFPPVPPSRADSQKDKPLPAVGSPAHRMSMQFPLRDDQDAPVSSDGSPVSQRRKRIIHRSLSREGKPPSLKLIVSNGATAIIPSTPGYPIPTKILSSSPPQNTKLPAPPVQSDQESSVESSAMETTHSRQMGELERNDSFHSQRRMRPMAAEESMTTETASVPKRKPLGPNAMKFVSLVEGEDAPRGRQGAPLPPTSAPRAVSTKPSIDEPRTTTVHTNASQAKKEPANGHESGVQGLGRIPPTPPEEEKTAPSPPRKVLINASVPSNSRSNGPTSPLHQRGKSSTGFNILKAHRPAPPIPTRNVETVTPEMTPSPTLKPRVPKDQEISPVSPLPPPSDRHHREPFPVPQATVQKSQEHLANLQIPAIAPPAPTPPAPALHTSTIDPPAPSPSIWPSSAPSHVISFSFSFSTHPAPTILSHASPNISPTNTSTETTTTNSPPPFTPLTRRPIPLPTTLIPQITPEQLSCYTSHSHNIWSNNWFQSMGCMVCHSNARDRKWCCTWCQLRVCRNCSEELAMVLGRKLDILLKARRSSGAEVRHEGMPGIVISAAVDDVEGHGHGREEVEKEEGQDEEHRGRPRQRELSS